MKKSVIAVAAKDYFKTRKSKNHIMKLLIAIVPAILVWYLLNKLDTNLITNPGIKIDEIFSGFVNVQISAIAILISFSIAIITILVSADNENIRSIRATPSTECKPFKRGDASISLFQVLLSNITYNVFIEAIYLVILIGYIFMQLFADDVLIKALMAVSVFFIIHIFHVLLESVGQMYLTFWKN